MALTPAVDQKLTALLDEVELAAVEIYEDKDWEKRAHAKAG